MKINALCINVVILGSSRLLIKDGLTESLTGRYELIRMSHWSYDEMRLLCGMQKYANDNARKYNSIPKMMVYNTALLSALSNSNFEKTYTTPNVWGRWVESAIGSYLLNKADELDYKLYYWRENNNEVDFVLEQNKQCVAIEVKSGKRTTNNGITIFGNKFHPRHSFIVGNGGISVEDFLTLDLENLFEL